MTDETKADEQATEGKSVEAEITLDADAAEVWRALTEGEELKRWFPLDARVTPGEGGGVWLSWGEGMAWESPITVWEPNRHLRVADPAPSKVAVDYHIEGRGGQTVLRIVHSGFGADAWDDELDTLNAGWHAFLATLRNYLAHHRGQPRVLAHYRHEAVQMPRAEAFTRMLEALGVPLVEAGQSFRSPHFEGVAEVVKPSVNFSAALTNHGRGFLMIEIEPGRKSCRPAFWVSLYGEDAASAPALQQTLTDLVMRAFASA